jgi:hypothetical protein
MFSAQLAVAAVSMVKQGNTRRRVLLANMLTSVMQGIAM